MGWRDRWRQVAGAVRWDGRSGPPRSSNGASSLHLRWVPDADGWEHDGGGIVEVAATLEVTEPPVVPALHFWALQASFADAGGRVHGGAHLGLQWYPAHPGSTAVNWGGYRDGGGELDGSRSALPSATGNGNTRDFAWRPRTPYRLTIRRVGSGGIWSGRVTDVAAGTETEVRTLSCPGDRLVVPMVWSEVFADCDAPSSAVRWRDLRVIHADGTVRRVRRMRTSYEAIADGGCADTDASSPADGGFVQRTSTSRRTAAGAVLVDQSQSSRS